MKKDKSTIDLPDLNWKQTTCVVCGELFDYISGKRPLTCKKGDCRYKFHYTIDKKNWAGYQFSLFEK